MLTIVVALLTISVSKKREDRILNKTTALVPRRLTKPAEDATKLPMTSITEKGGSPFKFCVHLNQLNRRGVEVANYDYITALQRLLEHQIVVACVTPQHVLDEEAAQVPDVFDRFDKACDGGIQGYEFGGRGWEERAPVGTWRYGGPNLVAKVRDLKCDMLYSLKSGEIASAPQVDEYSLRVPWAIHAVFTAHEPHGTMYAAVSKEVSLSQKCLLDSKDPDSTFVDHIVDLTEDEKRMNISRLRSHKRAELGIPSSSLVLCRHGGETTFNIDFVVQNIVTLVDANESVHLVLMNTLPLATQHARIHEVEGESTIIGKARFFAMCDAMLHARADGETFGLAVAEFSLRNKPVITYNGHDLEGYARAHLDILGDRGLYYHDVNSLHNIIAHLAREGISNRSWNAYAAYSSSNIILKFMRVFIKPAQDWWEQVQARQIGNVWEASYDELPPLDRRCI